MEAVPRVESDAEGNGRDEDDVDDVDDVDRQWMATWCVAFNVRLPAAATATARRRLRLLRMMKVLSGLTRFPSIPLGSTGFRRVLIGFYGFHWV